MPYRIRRNCVVCGKTGLKNLSSHMRHAHRTKVSTNKRIEKLPLLQQYSILPYTKKHAYIKQRAPREAIKVLRQVILNVLNGNVQVDNKKKLLDLDCEWLCSKLIEGDISKDRARRLLTCTKLMRFIDLVLPSVLKHLSQ